MNILSVNNLHVGFSTDKYGSVLEVVRGVSFNVERGGFYGLVGESGCGKSVTSMAITGLPPTDYAVRTGEIIFDGADILNLKASELRKVRGYKGISYVFQEHISALNPVLKVSTQLSECIPKTITAKGLRENRGHRKNRERMVELIEMVGLDNPQKVLDSYPCELSGGMAQRICIAMAMASEPSLIIADEPTTALDVITQKRILDLLDDLRKTYGTAILLITHNLGLIAEYTDTVSVMYAGCIVESGKVAEVINAPAHPYTCGLLSAVPSLDNCSVDDLGVIPGKVPNPADLTVGCAFAPRCKYCIKEKCLTEMPICVEISSKHSVLCFNPLYESAHSK